MCHAEEQFARFVFKTKLATEPTPRFGLVSCTGQAWIRILDLVKNQLEHTIDLSLLCLRRPYRGWTLRGWCVSGADKRTLSPPSCHVACTIDADRSTVRAPSCHVACSSWALESDTIGLSRAACVPSTLFLSSMRHHQVLRVLSACCPGLRFILLGPPSKQVSVAP